MFLYFDPWGILVTILNLFAIGLLAGLALFFIVKRSRKS